MPYTDSYAASRLTELREERGLSPEALAEDIAALAKREAWTKGTVHAHTIRRIEDEDHVPTIRVRIVITHYFGVPLRELWDPVRKRTTRREKAFA